MNLRLLIPGLTLGAALLLAQNDQTNMPAQTNSNTNTPTAAATTGNSWVGLLVASGCENPANPTATASADMNRSTPTGTTTGSAMTGPALNGSSGSGMNGTSTDVTGGSATGVSQTKTDANAHASGAADRMTTDQNFPKSTASAAHESSGSMNRATDSTSYMQKNTSDKGRMTAQTWDDAKTVAGQMGATCRISSTTSSFALRLPDGRLIPFDAASNSKIADQVRSRVSANSTKIFRVVVTGTMNGEVITADSIRL